MGGVRQGHPPLETVAILNPAAGHGNATRRWDFLLEALGRRTAGVTTWRAEGPQHVRALAARARKEGFERVLAVGGDGTLLEVLNGLWWESEGVLSSLGMVPLGSGCDYARNFSLGRSLQEQMATALGDGIAAVDVGLCRLSGLDGAPCARVFLNVLGFGFDAAVIGRLGRRRLKLGGRLPYLIAALQEMARARCFRIQGWVDDEPIRTEALILAAGLGRSFGGGMRITPEARSGSGRFQVVWGERLTRLELLCLLPKIYSGRHLNHPKVQSRYARRVELLAEPAALVEAEGELIGKTPIQLEIYPRSLRIACTRIR